MKATVWFDGACSGNPGPMGAGAVLEIGGESKILSRAMGHGTNNEAEYHAVIMGLRHALAAGATDIVLHGDSQLILRQLEGKYAVKAANLRPLFLDARSVMAKFKSVKFEWVPREQNAAADRASKDAIGI